MLVEILSLVLALIATRVLWRRWKYDLHKMPSPPGLPLLGHTAEFASGQAGHQMSQWMRGCLLKLGNPKLMRVDLAGKAFLIVTDLNYIKDVVLSKTAPLPKYLPNGGFTVPMIGNDPSSNSLLMTPALNPYVKAVRRIYTTAFQSKNLRLAVPKVDKVLKKMIEIIEAKREGPIEFQLLCVRMTLDAIGAVAFDANLGGLDESRDIHHLIIEAGYVAKTRYINAFKRTYFKLFPHCEEKRKGDAVINALTAEWDKLTKDILGRDDPPNDEEPLWFCLKHLKVPETDEPVPYKALLAEVATVVLAGMDSTGHQLGWLLALLASHPHVVEKLLEELKGHGLHGPEAREVTFDDLGDLSYLTAIIKEGMRIAHVMRTNFARYVPQDMAILGYRVPKDTLVMAPGTRTQNIEAVWGDPDVFRPERWLTDEDMTQKYVLGFSYGPRDCVGQRLAMLEMRLGIIKLLTRYQLTLKGSWEELNQNAKDGAVIEARDGVWLNVKPRPQAV